MSLINVLKQASLSRVNGGLILLRIGQPVLRGDLTQFIDEVQYSKDKRRNFYHLDEETCVLTNYQLIRNGEYIVVDTEVVSLAYLFEIQLKYEEMSGTDLRKLRYRSPFILPNDHVC